MLGVFIKGEAYLVILNLGLDNHLLSVLDFERPQSFSSVNLPGQARKDMVALLLGEKQVVVVLIVLIAGIIMKLGKPRTGS